VKGQIVTFDALLAFFILVFTILTLELIEIDLSPLDDLRLERKAMDFVRFLYEEKKGGLVLGVGRGDLREGVEKVGVEGVLVEDNGVVVFIGEKPDRFHSKYLLVPFFNSTEFRVVRLDVW